jgi:hypothetical protein
MPGSSSAANVTTPPMTPATSVACGPIAPVTGIGPGS